MKQDMLSTRIDHNTKEAFTNICEAIGLSTSQAIKLFAKAVINHGGIPFELRVRQPNNETCTAMTELADGKGHKADSLNSLLNGLTEGKVNNV
ncbi:damage-inducible protein J [Endozoicomonas sp. (ex Bugula neritina AB1)]|nr:damage-inducible protein J [Endozoicomonas sp. (ex Bugula neritina AB1)]